MLTPSIGRSGGYVLRIAMDAKKSPLLFNQSG